VKSGQMKPDETCSTDIPAENFLQGSRLIGSENIYDHTDI